MGLDSPDSHNKNEHTFDIFTNHCMDVEEYEEPGIRGLKFHYLTTGH